MKKYVIALITIVSISMGCEKENIQPNATTGKPNSSVEKEANKRKLYCNWTAADGHTIIAHGTKCTYSGDECGRSNRCTARLGFSQNPDDKVSDNMTLGEFIDYTKTDDGVDYLYSLGYYDVEEK